MILQLKGAISAITSSDKQSLFKPEELDLIFQVSGVVCVYVCIYVCV